MDFGIIGTWRMALEGLEKGLDILEAGGSAKDAVETVVVEVEDNENYHSVGYSGLPNEEGEVELDAAFMDGDDLSIGAVAGIKDYANPVKIARSLMDYKANNFLVGPGAEKYAHKMGFERKNMTSEVSKEKWLERINQKEEELTPYDGHDTVGVVGLDKNASMVAATSTSGLFMKKAGRVGDSPLSGSGFYADSDYGACVATGLGEDIMKGSISYEIVRLMKEGLHPQEAAEKAVGELNNLLIKKREKAGDISVVCMNTRGEWGASTNVEHFSFVVGTNEMEPTVYIASYKDNELKFTKPDKKWISTHTE